MAAEHPYDEQICGHLMLALYRAGRQAGALSTYQRMRRVLDTELGIGPGQPLRDLEMAILRQDPALSAPTRARTTATLTSAPGRPRSRVTSFPAAPVPAQLPAAVPGF